MIGKLDPEENVMDDSIAAKRKAIAVCNQGVVEELYDSVSYTHLTLPTIYSV